MRIKNSHNIGTIKCLLFWDGKTQGVFALPAVPQIESSILLESEDLQSLRAFTVVGVSMTAQAIPLEKFDSIDPEPACLSWVKVFLVEQDGDPLIETVLGPI